MSNESGDKDGQHVLMIVNMLLEDVVNDPSRLARAQEIAKRDLLPLLARSSCPPVDRNAVLEEGAQAYAELLREVQNTIPHDVGTDRQAYDHIIRRMQDKHGSYQAQIAKAVRRALKKAAPQVAQAARPEAAEAARTPAESAPINAPNHSAAGLAESQAPTTSELGDGGVAPTSSAPSGAPSAAPAAQEPK